MVAIFVLGKARATPFGRPEHGEGASYRSMGEHRPIPKNHPHNPPFRVGTADRSETAHALHPTVNFFLVWRTSRTIMKWVRASAGRFQCRAWSDGLQSVRRLLGPWVVGYAWARATAELRLVMDPRGVRSVSRQAKPQWRLPQGSAAPEAAFCLPQRSGLRPR